MNEFQSLIQNRATGILQRLPDALETSLKNNPFLTKQDIELQLNKAKTVAFTISQIENGRGFDSIDPLRHHKTPLW